MTELTIIQAALRAEAKRAAKPRDAALAKGRFGEILVESWLRERRQLDVTAVPQERGRKRELVGADAKRPDFLAIMTGDGDAAIPIIIDAKFHTVVDGLFSLSETEVEQFRATLKQWGMGWCVIALIQAQHPNAITLIALSEMTHDPSMRRHVFDVDAATGREEIAYARARDQLAREGYDVALVPDYPGASGDGGR